MAVLLAAPPALSGDIVLFHTTDPFLANAPVLVFYGPAATVGSTSSRVQLHIFTIAGHASYNRLAISPSSPFYTAVRNLPREEQGDESIRSIAFGLRKYFAELPASVKDELAQQVKSRSAASLFGDDHVAILASRLNAVQNVKEVGEDLVRSFAEQRMSWTDVDIILPPGAIKDVKQDDLRNDSDQALSRLRYGKYADVVNTFGDVSFLPTSRLKRAPSTVSTIGRSASFLRQQKQKARQEVLEFVGTEQNYAARLQELEQIRQSMQASTGVQLLKSISRMLATHQSLLSSIRSIIDSTASSSEHEIESMTVEQPTANQIRQDLLADNHGIVAFSKSLCTELPKLREPYVEYMKDQDLDTKALRATLRSPAPPTALTVLGEQRLTSLLIEPVQRLPRYTLYIDEISKQLPARHPALKHLLKARDIVSSICDEGEDDAVEESIALKLRARIDGWPEDLTGIGRLITAIDYVLLRPPYNIEVSVQERGMLLLTTDGVAMVEKPEHRSVSARVFLTDIEAARQPATPSKEHTFLRWLPLPSIECAESHEGQSICLTILPETGGPAESSMVLLLEGSYEGKAARLTEEIAKARVEARFSEAEREGSKWEVRASPTMTNSLRLFGAIFDESNAAHRASRRDMAFVKVVVDVDKHSLRYRAGADGSHTVLALSLLRDGTYRLSTDTVEGAGMSEQVSLAELASTMQRRIACALASRHGPHSLGMLKLRIHHARDVLQSLQLKTAGPEVAAKDLQQEQAALRQSTSRPLSPVKMLSSLLSSSIGPGSQPPNLLKKEISGTSLMRTGASFNMSVGAKSSSQVVGSRPPSNDQPRPKSSSSSRSFITTSEPVKKIEETLSAYVMALKARKGNIVGRNLRLRAEADELAVNELYNHLLESPQTMSHAAQAPLDVLFAAFEKFLRIAWADQLGPVLPMSFLSKTQAKADALFPTDFDEYFRSAVCSLPSSCQSAFRSIISLLNDLLDGTGNDADRGALTAAFAEVLVVEGDANQYIALIDKFVDDAETYFGEPVSDSMLQSELDQSIASSHKRSRSVNTGSLTSNTSSLRRKFGLGGLSRENSRSEADRKTNSVWRTLSKSRSKEASPGSTLSSQSALQRARSTDSEHRSQERPVSSDSQISRSQYGDTLAVPTLPPAVLPGLSTIGEHPSFIPTGPPRKKRRSSLSDLKVLATPFATPQRPDRSPQADHSKLLPSSPISSTPSSKNNSIRLTTTSRITPRPGIPAAFRQDVKSQASTPVRSSSSIVLTQEGNVSPGSKQRQASNIPTLASRAISPTKVLPSTPQRAGLSERVDGGNSMKRPPQQQDKDVTAVSQPVLTSPTKKMRLQSPAKIRERLQTEQAAIVAAHSTLQDELRRLGNELAATPSRMPSIRETPAMDENQSASLDSRLARVEASSSEHFASMSVKYEKLHTDALASLTAYETRSKKLDELYRQANAENEALYGRFNEELAKVLKAVRGGDGVEQLKSRSKQQEDEIARLRRENARLKREIAGAVQR